MEFLKSLKISKLKIILTSILGIIWYFIILFLSTICIKNPSYIRPESVLDNVRLLYACGETTVSVLLIEYLIIFIPILTFYIIYSFIQYKMSK